MNDHEFIQTKILQGRPHRPGHGRSCGALELEAESTVAANDEEIEFGAGVCGPEETLFRLGGNPRHDDVEREAFPRGPNLGVRFNLAGGPEAEEGVQQPAVTDIDLGRLDLPLADVLVPALELPHHECICQYVEVSPDCCVPDPEGSRELGGVPDLSMVVCEHHPEPAQCRCRQAKTDRRNVSLEVRSYEFPAAAEALDLGTGEIRTGESAPSP